jgi:hypothetical protein
MGAMTEWRSPGVLVGMAAILVAVVLFVADQLVPDEQFAQGFRDALSVAGQAAPWIGAFGMALGIGLIASGLMDIRRSFASVRERQRIAQERMRQLESELEETNKALKAGSGERVQTRAKPPRRQWASMSSGVVRLALPNSEVEAMYERAISVLNERDLEPRLTWFWVRVDPYGDPPKRVHVSLDFYSDRSGRLYSFWMTDDGHLTEDRTGTRSLMQPSMYDRLPWREQPEWSGIFNLAAERAGPLIRDPDTSLRIMALPSTSPLEWPMYVEDYGARRQLNFRGSSAADMRQSAY